MEHELYDVIASLSENYYVEARNASWDRQAGTVLAEQVGQIVDVNATIEALLSQLRPTVVDCVMVHILPSITQKHFQAYRRGRQRILVMALMVNVDWGDEFIEPCLRFPRNTRFW